MTTNTRSHQQGAQRGAVTLAVTLGLCAVLLLATLFAHRGGLVDARLSTQQTRSTVAFEAAEAGIDWAVTQLNQPQRIGPDCNINTGASAFSFRERYLTMNPACVRTAEGWACNCPSDGASSPSSLGGNATTPAFRLRFAPGHEPGSVRVTSTGGPGTSIEASARVEVLLASLPALASAPAAPLTVRGDVATPAPIGWHNSDPRSGGVAVHAGGTIAAPQARTGAPAGSSTTQSLAAHDAHLAGMSPQRLFTAYFGLPKNTWLEQSIVRRLACPGPCAAALAETLRNDPQASQLWIDGDLDLEGPLALGSIEHPLVIVASGSIRLRGAVQMHGVLYGQNVSWQQATAPEAFVRGALIAEGSYGGDAAADLVYDTTVLDTLRRQRGSFVRVPAGWRDF